MENVTFTKAISDRRMVLYGVLIAWLFYWNLDS